MTGRVDVERILDLYLAPEPERLADRVIEAALGEIGRTSQRRALHLPRRFALPRNRSSLAVLGAVMVAGLLIAGVIYSIAGDNQPLPTTTPTPAASSSEPLPVTSPSFTATQGLELGPGVAGVQGTVVFGLRDRVSGFDTMYAAKPDGSRAWSIVHDACCLIVPPDGRAAMYATSATGRTIPGIAALPHGFSFSEEQSTWAKLAPDLDLFPRAWSATWDIAFEGRSATDPARAGVYLSKDNGGGQVYGTLVRLTTPPPGVADIPIAFSPDGSKLLFVRDVFEADGIGLLYVIGTDGSGLRNLNHRGTGVSAGSTFGGSASWAPDGSKVTFSAFDQIAQAFGPPSSIYVVDAGSGSDRAITGNAPNGSARWSPDGQWIAYDEGVAGHQDVWLVRPDGSQPHLLTFTDTSCCAVWSPDSAMLLVVGSDADGPDLFIAQAEGADYSRLLTVGSADDIGWTGWGPLSPNVP